MLCWKLEDVHVSLKIFRLVQVLLVIEKEFRFLFVVFITFSIKHGLILGPLGDHYIMTQCREGEFEYHYYEES